MGDEMEKFSPSIRLSRFSRGDVHRCLGLTFAIKSSALVHEPESIIQGTCVVGEVWFNRVVRTFKIEERFFFYSHGEIGKHFVTLDHTG